MFEEQLPQAMNAQPFAQLLSIQSVKRIIQDSDGYQPFLVAPENGYRALVREGVKLMETPAATAVDAVDMVLRDIGQKVCFFVHLNIWVSRMPELCFTAAVITISSIRYRCHVSTCNMHIGENVDVLVATRFHLGARDIVLSTAW